MLHISERQMRSWERLGFIPAQPIIPSATSSRFAHSANCAPTAFRSRRIARALESLKRLLSEVQRPLAELKIFSDGRRIAVRVAGQNMEASTGQILFDFETAGAGPRAAVPVQPPPAPRERESEAWFQKGLFLEETGAPVEQAVEAYLRAVEFNPQAAGALVNLGTIHYRLRQFQEAERYYAQSARRPIPPIRWRISIWAISTTSAAIWPKPTLLRERLAAESRLWRRALQSRAAVRTHAATRCGPSTTGRRI